MRIQDKLFIRKIEKSIDQRPILVNNKQSFVHWEIDSVLGLKNKDDNTLLTLGEMRTRYMITIILDGQTEESVCYALKQ